MNQADNQIRVFGIKTVLLIILIKNGISKKMKFIRVLYTFKINYNLVSNRRFRVYGYYFHGGDDTIRHINNNSELTSASLIKKGLYKFFLAGPGVHYVLQKSPINIKIWY